MGSSGRAWAGADDAPDPVTAPPAVATAGADRTAGAGGGGGPPPGAPPGGGAGAEGAAVTAMAASTAVSTVRARARRRPPLTSNMTTLSAVTGDGRCIGVPSSAGGREPDDVPGDRRQDGA